MVEADSEERCAAGMAIAAPVEAEDELVETGLDMSARRLSWRVELHNQPKKIISVDLTK